MHDLLVVGPLPPPLVGTPVSFDIFCQQTKKSPRVQNLIIVDASPKFLKQQKTLVFSIKNIKQALSIVLNFIAGIRKVDSTIIFGSNGYVITMAPILLIIAKIARRKWYFRVFGGSLDQYIKGLKPPLKWVALTTLNNYSGIIVQTELLSKELSILLKNNAVHHVAGYRVPPEIKYEVKTSKPGSKLRIVFVGIVKKDKGVFILLEAMRCLKARNVDVELTMYGTMHEPVREEFEQLISCLDNTQYNGVLDWRDMIATLSTYDALILPTFYHSEGHPGVLIEAMMASIPIISTNFRSIPEIVTHEHNGLLVAPSSAQEITEAIERLYFDRDLLLQLSLKNAAKSTQFSAEKLAAKIVKIATSK